MSCKAKGISCMAPEGMASNELRIPGGKEQFELIRVKSGVAFGQYILLALDFCWHQKKKKKRVGADFLFF